MTEAQLVEAIARALHRQATDCSDDAWHVISNTSRELWRARAHTALAEPPLDIPAAPDADPFDIPEHLRKAPPAGKDAG